MNRYLKKLNDSNPILPYVAGSPLPETDFEATSKISNRTFKITYRSEPNGIIIYNFELKKDEEDNDDDQNQSDSLEEVGETVNSELISVYQSASVTQALATNSQLANQLSVAPINTCSVRVPSIASGMNRISANVNCYANMFQLFARGGGSDLDGVSDELCYSR